MERMTPSTLANKLRQAGLEDHWATAFEEHEVNGEAFYALTTSDLYVMFPGKMGICRRILSIRENVLNMDEEIESSFVDAVLQDNIMRSTSSEDVTYVTSPSSSKMGDQSPGRCSRILWSIPKFSSRVEVGLSSGNILPVFNTLVEESAHFLMSNGDITKKGQYDHFGQALYTKYPCIGFPNESGKKPWSFFTGKLSQKLRNLRMVQKKQGIQAAKYTTATSANIRFEVATIKGNDPVEVQSLLEKEIQKERPNKEDIKKLFKHLHAERRTVIRGLDISPSEVVEKYPLFLKIEFSGDTLENEIALLMWLQIQLDDGRVTKTTKKQAIELADAQEAADFLHASKKRDPPSLLLVRHHVDPHIQGWIQGDGLTIQCYAGDNDWVIFDCIISLMASYYAFDLSYPKCFQILGFLQTLVVRDTTSPFYKTTKYCRLAKLIADSDSDTNCNSL